MSTHSFGEWVETTAATCITQGIKVRVCSCGQSDTQYISIDTNAHIPASEWMTDGENHWKACTRTCCEVELNKAIHSFGEWQQTLAATCVAQGSHYKRCTICSHEVTEVIPIDTSAHSSASEWKTDGEKHWKVCTYTGCGAELHKTSHNNYRGWSMTSENHWSTCITCGYSSDWEAHLYEVENTCVCGYYKDSGVIFTLKDDTYVVADYRGSASEVIIPSKYKGVSVASIRGYAFQDCDSLKAITILDSVTSIGWATFQDCDSLTSVTFTGNSQLTNIAPSTFENCKSLTSITIPNSVISIDNSAFDGCRGLISIALPNSVISIGNYAFNGCTSLSSVEIPNSVTSIGDFAFEGCRSLSAVEIPNSVTSIGEHAFYDCKLLSSITIPNSVTSIGYAFSGCDSLVSVTIPNSVTSLASSLLIGCSGLKTVYYGGTEGDWLMISVDCFWLPFGATQYYYSGEAPTTAGNYWHYDENGNVVVWQ